MNKKINRKLDRSYISTLKPINTANTLSRAAKCKKYRKTNKQVAKFLNLLTMVKVHTRKLDGL